MDERRRSRATNSDTGTPLKAGKDTNDKLRLILLPSGREYLVAKGDTILQAIGEEVSPAPCGGKGVCGRCQIIATPRESLSAPTSKEREALGERRIEANRRLACQAKIMGEVTVAATSLSSDDPSVSRRKKLGGRYPVAPAVERLLLPARPRIAEDLPRDLATSCRKAASGGRKELLFSDPQAALDLSRIANPQDELTLVTHGKKGVTAVLPGHSAKSLGFALDIGTTTLAAYLCDLRQGNILLSRAATNPQGRFGGDVISRIAYINEREDGLVKLQGILVEAINRLMDESLSLAGFSRRDVDEVVVLGNSAMQHIFALIHPRSLGAWPYLPVVAEPLDRRAAEVGLDLPAGANVHIFPAISGYLGGDTVGAILSQGLDRARRHTLLLDIGTNGELVMGSKDGLWATSCATGPALEGAQIGDGMSALAGAIDKVEIDAETFCCRCRTIGGSAPRGICGSGIVDALAEMRRTGLLAPSGRIEVGKPGVVLDDKGIAASFALTAADVTNSSPAIRLTLSDVRQIQLAKAALAAGVKLLGKRCGAAVPPETVILTGAFGARFNWQNAVAIGMLPKPVPTTKVKVVENAAGLGAVQALLDRKQRSRARRISSSVQYIELANDPEFSGLFLDSLNFS